MWDGVDIAGPLDMILPIYHTRRAGYTIGGILSILTISKIVLDNGPVVLYTLYG